ncbi:MAG: myxosortase-dependent M36 family metallopeptidase [Archangium sp.]|nr:myxosortase-dependent M36 family metallopeptidase [Archangium sp.]
MRLLPALILIASAAFARDLPNVDAFLDSTGVRPAPSGDGHIASVEPRLGVPTFFWAAPPAPGTRSPRDQGLGIEQAARRYLFTHAAMYRAEPAQLAEAALVRLHDTGQGAIIASFEKRVGGVSVFRDRLHVAMNQRLELVALSGYLSPASLKSGDFKLTAPTALATSWFSLLGTPVESFQFVEGSIDQAGFRRFTGERVGPSTPLGVNGGLGRAKKVLYALPERLVPAWHVELDVATPGETSSSMYSFVISAEDGAVLSRKNLTEADQYTYRVWAQGSGLYLPDDGPQGTGASPHPTGTPSGFNMPFTMPSLVTLQNGPISTNDPWLPPNATETTGNNVEAYADLVTPDGFNTGDLRASTTSPNTFDRTYDVALAPDASPAQQQAGITQLFFNLNQLHDWFYDRGFDEAAGNGQTDNFTRGGAGADSIKAEAQDFNGTNNANMSTPADGARPRMQMYVWIPDGLATLTATPGGAYATNSAAFGAQTFTLTANVMLVNDGTGTVTDGCTAMSGLTGRIALIDRGSCTFAVKARNAQTAGAVGVIIANNAAGGPPFLGPDSTVTTVTIPALSVTQADGNALKANLMSGTVSVTMTGVAGTERAGEVDNTVVGHEWGHYLSNRLISDAAGLSNQQGRSMGEGWADVVALLLMVRESDLQVPSNANWAGVYAPAAYALLGPGFLDATYFGIRRYPYSTDLTKNPLTFKHIENGVALPMGPPSSSGGATNAEVHNSGEVWAVAVWECYAALLRATPRLTFDQARDRMIRYLVAGLKLTPAQPTFTEARDGLLAAAAASDVADFQLFATAFARRGMGMRAVSPVRSSTTHAGVIEDFDISNELVFVSAELDDEAAWCDRDGVLDVGERGRLRLTLRNVGIGTLIATTGTLSTTTPGVTIINPTVPFTSSQPFANATGQAQVSLTGFTAPTTIDLTLTFNDPALMSAAGRTATMSFRVHSDSVPASSATDDAESSLTAWTFTKDTALSSAFDWARRSLSPAQNVWYGLNPGGNADIALVSPPLNVAATGSLGLVLNHRWDFEAGGGINYDGAVIEVSTNAGMTWTDVGAAIAGYTGTLGGPSSNNPLVGRPAFTGSSPGYPMFNTSTLNLGSSYAGQTVQVRLRIGSDQASAGAGWDVDSIGFTGITNTPFPSLVADRGQCINRAPVANAGPDVTVDERSMVTLTSSASTDPDNDPLVARWTQLTGPTVTLTNGAFTAPEVTVDTALSFGLIVNDGTLDSAPDTVEVMVRQVNRAPVANAGPAQSVDERTTASLAGGGTDADGDLLTFSWSQLSGPLVTLSDTTVPTPQFVAPEVGGPEVVVLQLVVSDGSLPWSVATVNIEVRPVNRPPALTLRAPATAPERSTVALDATGLDLEGDPLTYQWRQTAGPPVIIATATVNLETTAAMATFVAPEVLGDTPLSFEVVGHDGTLFETATVTTIILNVNRPPVAVIAGESREVKAGEVVQLDATGSSDPDGEALTFAWTQASGDAVALSGADAAVASFTMPKSGVVTFTVTVSDPAGATGEATQTLTASAAAPTGCGCTSSGGLLFPLLALLALRRRRD